MTKPYAIISLGVAILFSIQSAHAEPPSADDLVKAVCDSEQWIHKVDSFLVRMDGVWTKTPEAIERSKAARRKEFPGDALDIKRWPEFLPESRETVLIAFDDKRLYSRQNQPTSSDVISFWDGKQTLTHEKYFSHKQEHYAIEATPKRLGEYFLSNWSWLRADETHSFWWNPRDANSAGYRFDQEGAQKWQVIGREKYHGIDCWILEKEYGWTRWYVGVERPLAHGMITYVSKRNSDDTPIANAIARQFGGPVVKSEDEFFAWKEALPKEREAEVQAAYVRATLKNAYPLVEHMLLDYKEVQLGCWFPMSQGYDFHNADVEPVIVSGSRRFKVAEIKLNQPLPDDVFKMEFDEGVEVNNWAHQPPLHYKHKKQFTDAEWTTIVDEAKKNDAFWIKQKEEQAALIGKAAPAFPEKSEWINAAEPLTLEKLKGKVVVIDFFADWCGPCRNDLPRMAELHKDAKKPFVVMAIHPPGSERASIDKIIKEFDLAYPICIDVPHPEAWGKLYAAYNVKSIPHAIVLDKEGKIAAQGSLGEMVGKAYELSR